MESAEEGVTLYTILDEENYLHLPPEAVKVLGEEVIVTCLSPSYGMIRTNAEFEVMSDWLHAQENSDADFIHLMLDRYSGTVEITSEGLMPVHKGILNCLKLQTGSVRLTIKGPGVVDFCGG
jgi:hypothetical protein